MNECNFDETTNRVHPSNSLDLSIILSAAVGLQKYLIALRNHSFDDGILESKVEQIL